MIKNKIDLIEYLEADKRALGRTGKWPGMFDYIWKYEILLRKTEYYTNTSKGIHTRLLGSYYKYRLIKLGLKCGFTINVNSCGKGLNIAHTGLIIINGFLGDYCRVHCGVNIGVKAGTNDEKPVIGNNCYIGPGVKIFGNVTIADGIAIGANAVVNKSFTQKNITIAGIPAKKISDKGSLGLLYIPENELQQ